MQEISLEKDILSIICWLLGDSLLNQIKYLEILVCLITLDKGLSKCSL